MRERLGLSRRPVRISTWLPRRAAGSTLRTSPKRRGWLSHTGRFLGTAPQRATRQASHLLPWRVRRGVAIPGCRVYSRVNCVHWDHS